MTHPSFQSIKDLKIGPQDVKERRPIHDIITKFIWLISTARNIIVVVFSAVLAYCFELHGSSPFLLTGFIKPGLPEFKPPPFEATIDNTTYTFVDMTSSLGSAIIVVPLLAILENIALAKVFGKFEKKSRKKRKFKFLLQLMEKQLMQHKRC